MRKDYCIQIYWDNIDGRSVRGYNIMKNKLARFRGMCCSWEELQSALTYIRGVLDSYGVYGIAIYYAEYEPSYRRRKIAIVLYKSEKSFRDKCPDRPRYQVFLPDRECCCHGDIFARKRLERVRACYEVMYKEWDAEYDRHQADETALAESIIGLIKQIKCWQTIGRITEAQGRHEQDMLRLQTEDRRRYIESQKSRFEVD